MKVFATYIARACIALLAVSSIDAVGAPLYSVTDLSKLNGGSNAYGLSDMGLVTGGAGGYGVGAQVAFVANSDGTDVHTIGALNLGPLRPGMEDPTTYSMGRGINDSGQVAGTSYSDGLQRNHAFMYDGTSMQDIGTLGGRSSTGTAINASGVVVGWSQTNQVVPPGSATSGSSIEHAFIYQNGVMKDLGTINGFTDSYAYAVNASGWVTGSVATTYSQQAFIYNGSRMSLIAPGLGNSVGSSINAQGWVAGTAAGSAFLYRDGQVINLGSGFWSSSAKGINDSGYVVGQTEDSSYRAFGSVYDGSTVLNLNRLLDAGSSSWYIMDAVAINNNGQILAIAQDYLGNHTVLLTPVPEPTSGLLTGLGLGGVGMTALAKRRRGKHA